jgi:hypothetical protein
VILANPGLNLTDDGVGHTLATATALPLTGSTVNAAFAKGSINSASQTNPQPLGVANYTTDFFKFATNGTSINLVLNAGGDLITPGVADPGATFDGSFNIIDAMTDQVVGTSTRDSSTLFYTFARLLPAGSYDAQVIDYGGYTSPTEAATGYYTSGAYFFTGSGGFVDTPEPTAFSILGISAFGLLGRRRRSI